MAGEDFSLNDLVGGGSAIDLSSMYQGGPYAPDVSPINTTPTAPTSDVSFMSKLGDYFSGAGDIAKSALQYAGPIANIGATALQVPLAIHAMDLQGAQEKALRQGTAASKVGTQLEQQAAGTAQAAAAPALATGTQLAESGLSALLGGDLPSGLQDEVDNWIREARASIKSKLAGMNIDDSMMEAEYEGWIQEQAGLLKEQLAEQLYSGGITGLGQAAQAAGTEAGAAGSMTQVPTIANLPDSSQSLATASAALAKLLAQGQ